MNTHLLTTDIRDESDVVFVRQRARQIATLLKFDAREQTRIATAVSEIARNAFLYAREGRARFSIEGSGPEHLMIRISDRGQGVTQLPLILAGNYKSERGMGLGMLGAKRLMDSFEVETVPGHGTTVELGMALPSNASVVPPEMVARIGSELAKTSPGGPMEEIRVQNAELLRVLDDLKGRQLDLERTYQELAESNRLLAEVNARLEDKALALERTATSERAARAEAEAAVGARDNMLAIVSHDLRNPLSAIMLCSQVLTKMAPVGVPGDQARSAGGTITRAATRMKRLITDLLDLAQMQSGGLSIVCTDCLAEALVHDGLELIRAVATERSLTIEGAAEPGLRVHCDRERVMQILSNLLGNAVKFTPVGGALELVATADGDEVMFEVRDTGPGIAESELPRIFDRFWQAQNARTGIGLGLSIVKGLVEGHGGRVWVVSTPGAGASFRFTLPRSR